MPTQRIHLRNQRRLILIFVCAANGMHWFASADCGANNKCVENPLGVAHCVPKVKMLNAARGKAESTPTPSLPESYQPGTYKCAWYNKYIYVCANNGKWVVSADCGAEQSCVVESDGLPHCRTSRRAIAARDGTDISCPASWLGYYSCWHNPATRGSAWVVVCDGLRWLWSSDCGRLSCVGTGGAAQGVLAAPKNAASMGTVSLIAELAKTSRPYLHRSNVAKTSRICLHHERRGYVPGTYRCSGENILTCNALGNWVQSAYCGKNWICKEGPAGVAHCLPRTPSVKARDVVTREEMPKSCPPGRYRCW
jgi:hypothetical protein